MPELYTPGVSDLWFKEAMLRDEQTMSYNHAYGGTIAFPREKWALWHKKWITAHEGKRFYRYLADGDTFIGEIAYRFDEESRHFLADVLIYAPHRGKGYGRKALQLLCEAARKNGIGTLYDEIAIDNPAAALFFSCGFEEVLRTDEYILVKKDLGA